jgi:hypothetical protein
MSSTTVIWARRASATRCGHKLADLGAHLGLMDGLLVLGPGLEAALAALHERVHPPLDLGLLEVVPPLTSDAIASPQRRPAMTDGAAPGHRPRIVDEVQVRPVREAARRNEELRPEYRMDRVRSGEPLQRHFPTIAEADVARGVRQRLRERRDENLTAAGCGRDPCRKDHVLAEKVVCLPDGLARV